MEKVACQSEKKFLSTQKLGGKWVKIFKNRPRKICGIQTLKDLK